MFKKSFTALSTLFLACAVSVITAVPAIAAPTTDDIWAKMDISGIEAKIIPLAITCVGITVVGVVWHYATKAGKKSKSAL